MVDFHTKEWCGRLVSPLHLGTVELFGTINPGVTPSATSPKVKGTSLHGYESGASRVFCGFYFFIYLRGSWFVSLWESTADSCASSQGDIWVTICIFFWWYNSALKVTEFSAANYYMDDTLSPLVSKSREFYGWRILLNPRSRFMWRVPTAWRSCDDFLLVNLGLLRKRFKAGLSRCNCKFINWIIVATDDSLR